jgi:hypothetical protein
MFSPRIPDFRSEGRAAHRPTATKLALTGVTVAALTGLVLQGALVATADDLDQNATTAVPQSAPAAPDAAAAAADAAPIAPEAVSPAPDSAPAQPTEQASVPAPALDPSPTPTPDPVPEARPSAALQAADPVGNQPPMAIDDFFVLAANTTLTISAPGVLANDVDPDGDALSVIPGTFWSSGGGGVVNLSADGSFTFATAPGFTGADSFSYSVLAGGQASAAPGVVKLLVAATTDHPPVAVPDFYSTSAGTMLHVGYPGILANDTDPDGDVVSLPHGYDYGDSFPTSKGGYVAWAGSGAFDYFPPAGFIGTDTFYYWVKDATLQSDLTTVTITVGPSANHAPVAVDDDYSTPKNVLLTVGANTGVLGNDSDEDGDTLSVLAGTIFSTDAGGNATINTDGSFSYQPPVDFVGTDTFPYGLLDGRGGESVVAYVHIAVTDPTDGSGPGAPTAGGQSSTSALDPQNTTRTTKLASTGGAALAPLTASIGFLTLGGIMMLAAAARRRWLRRR